MTTTGKTLYQILKDKYGSDSDIAKAFCVERPTVFTWRKTTPEKIALLCHISPEIPYTYNPADYGRNPENLSLVLTKPAC
ncbi:hypothetical protein IM876_15865 [Serratia plymuthica]|uniref:hypothetical protein n=1 Tax=Serratia plymuthica TaxID=82996 RepID=UPI001928F3B7|nr:hypothetical protein [Serratia plymuthica]MBL3524155.1 hypothetical protein [Serratia plymuthica]